VEWTILGGLWVFGIFFFAILLKLVPVIELPEDIPVKTGSKYVFLPLISLPRVFKNLLICSTFVFGLGMMCYGVLTWNHDYAPIKWLLGIFALCVIPLEICIIVPLEEVERKKKYFIPTSAKGYTQSVRKYLIK
jgi:hypothetical protein